MTTEYEQIHELVRLDPESVWDRLRSSSVDQAPMTKAMWIGWNASTSLRT